MARNRNNKPAPAPAEAAPEAVAPEAAPADPVAGDGAPPVAPEPLTLTLKAKRQVTRYTITYKGVTYDSPRKAFDAAGLTSYKGSAMRTVLAGKPVGTKVVVEGHEFIYAGAPAK